MKLLFAVSILCLFSLQVSSSELSIESVKSTTTPLSKSLSKTTVGSIVDKFSQNINWNELNRTNISLSRALVRTFEKMRNVELLMTQSSIEEDSFFQSKERLTDFYLFNQYVGSINQEWFVGGDGHFGVDPEAKSSFVDRARMAILIHIMLGASGQYDEYYHKTLAISLLANCFPNSNIHSLCKNENEKNNFVKMISPYFQESTLIADGGGSTGAIGGGDLLSVLLKIELTTNLLVHINLDSNCENKEYGLKVICETWPDKFSYIDTVLKFEIESKQNITEVKSEWVAEGIIHITVPKVVMTKADQVEAAKENLLVKKINKLQTDILVQLFKNKGKN